MRIDRESRGAGLGTLVVGAALVAGCATIRMVPPRDLAEQSDVFEATERSLFSGLFADESFVLGRYRVAEVDREWGSGSRSAHGVSSGGKNAYSNFTETSEGGYTFQFREGEDALAGQCSESTRRSGVELGTRHSLSSVETSLVCVCGAGESPARLELVDGKGDPVGRLIFAWGTADLTLVTKVNSSIRTKAGFRADLAGRPLGAVEVLHPGRIWLSQSLDAAERRQLGCLLAGLLLHDGD